MKKLIIFVILFVFIGELMLRLDKKFTVLEEKRIVKIKTSIEITPEYEFLQDTSFSFSPNDLKIMVLGDSYIHGGGIEFKDNFSQTLKHLINSEKGAFNNGWVLDVSRPSANNLDHNITYFQFVEKYNPNVVILGYNNNDVNGMLTKTKTTDFTKREMSSNKNISFIKKLYNIAYKSEFVHYVMHSLHNELKANGYIIKGSRADLALKSYWQNKESWVKSKELLNEIIEHSKNNGIQLIVYKFPEINLIEYPELFTKTNESIRDFFNGHNSLNYIDGSDSFNGEKSEVYRLSKYDGHPNEKAHKKMANEVFDIIKKTNQVYTENNARTHNNIGIKAQLSQKKR